jgi:tetratricopeptide (TPR) repeat protein
MYCYAIGDTDCWHAATTRMLATRKRFFVQTWQARMLYESGLPHEAIQSLLPVVEYFDQTGAAYGNFETRTNLAALYHLTGDIEHRDAVLETVVAPSMFGIEHGYESWLAYFDLAAAASARGDVDEALRNMEEAYARGFRQIWQFHHRIAFDKLRDNPEFQSLVERIRSENAAQLAVRGHQE